MKNSKKIFNILLFALPIIMCFSCSKGEKIIASKFADGKTPALIYYMKDGKKVYEERFYPNGQMRSEGKYEGDLRSGVWKYYFEDGELFAKIEFKSNNEVKNCQVFQSKDNKIIDKGDEIKFVGFSSYEPSPVTIEVKRKDYDEHYRFYNSFHIMEKITLKGNTPNGLSMSWFENGNIQSESYYKDGMQDSVYTVYAESGQKIIMGHYNKDTKVGKWEFYSSAGQPQGVTIYDDKGAVLKDNTNSGLIYHRKPLSQTDSTAKQQ